MMFRRHMIQVIVKRKCEYILLKDEQTSIGIRLKDSLGFVDILKYLQSVSNELVGNKFVNHRNGVNTIAKDILLFKRLQTQISKLQLF